MKKEAPTLLGAALLFVIGTAASCPSQSPSDYKPVTDREKVRWVMGRADRLVLECQIEGAEEMNPEGIKVRLEEMVEKYRSIDGLRPFEDAARNELFPKVLAASIGKLEELASIRWTKQNRQDQYMALKGACKWCHSQLKIKDLTFPDKLYSERVIEMAGMKSKEACGKCHSSIYDEWKETLHAKAWVDPVYRMSFGRREPSVMCRACHSMMPLLASGYSVAYEWRPYFRNFNQEEGVNCVSCHVRHDGTVAARTTNPDAPCKPVADKRITTTQYCGACHNPSHSAWFEWEESLYAKKGQDCNSCHTQKVIRTGADGKQKLGVDHKWLGGFDEAFVKKSIRTKTRIEGRKIIMDVENLTSHRFPGEVPSRTFIIRIRWGDADGKFIDEDYMNFRRPFKTAVGEPDNRLRPDEKRTITYTVPENAKQVVVHYLFKPTPFMMERGWFVLGQWEGKIE